MNVLSDIVKDVEAAHADFDDEDFLNVLLMPLALPPSNKRPIDLICDAVYNKDATLFQIVHSEMEQQLKLLNCLILLSILVLI